jgi:hypothetical protein
LAGCSRFATGLPVSARGAVAQHLDIRQTPWRHEMLIPSAHRAEEAMSLDDLIDLHFLLEADALFIELLGGASLDGGLPPTASHR